MKKTYLLLTLSLLALVSCGGNGNNTTTNKVEDTTTEATTEAPKGYEVNVKNEDGTPFSETIYAKWCTDENCFMPVEVKNGYAYNKVLSNKEAGTYYVHFDSLDSKYMYNPNAQATPENKSLDITIYTIKSITENKIATGVYKVDVTGGSKTSLTLDTTKKGKYIVESWVDYGKMTSSQLNVNPSIYMNDELLDDDSGYSKNFKTEIPTTDANEVTLQFAANTTTSYYFIVSYIA